MEYIIQIPNTGSKIHHSLLSDNPNTENQLLLHVAPVIPIVVKRKENKTNHRRPQVP